MVNFIKTRPVKAQIFSLLSEDLFQNINPCYIIARQDGRHMAEYLCLRTPRTENVFGRGQLLSNSCFVVLMAYLAHIFMKLNELNASLQGTSVLKLSDKLNAFIAKMYLRKRKLRMNHNCHVPQPSAGY